ncbi:MAG: phenylacetate--CoA ligase [Alphaproteobacteria bacterium]|nr:phenylacetate--CoA ligase [Alphaproteobacteria bacterium]
MQAESNLVEILEKNVGPCRPGEFGQVVVTPLHAFAMPLLRYVNGDLAEAGGSAACGRGLPVIRRVLGRERQMVRLPNGDVFYPQDLGGLVAGLRKIRQFQLVRTAETQMEVRLSVRAPLDDDEGALLRKRIHDRFQYPFDVSFTYMDVIPREPSGKFFDFKSEVG